MLRLGIETGMGPTRINTILQSAFFKLANIIPEERAIDLMKAAAKATYGRKGEDVVKKNWAAIDAGAQNVVEIEVPESWKNGEDEGLEYDSRNRAEEQTLLISSTPFRPLSTLRKVTTCRYLHLPIM